MDQNACRNKKSEMHFYSPWKLSTVNGDLIPRDPDKLSTEKLQDIQDVASNRNLLNGDLCVNGKRKERNNNYNNTSPSDVILHMNTSNTICYFHIIDDNDRHHYRNSDNRQNLSSPLLLAKPLRSILNCNSEVLNSLIHQCKVSGSCRKSSLQGVENTTASLRIDWKKQLISHLRSVGIDIPHFREHYLPVPSVGLDNRGNEGLLLAHRCFCRLVSL